MEIVGTIRKVRVDCNFDTIVKNLLVAGIDAFRINYAKFDDGKLMQEDFWDLYERVAKYTNNVLIDLPYPGSKYRLHSPKAKVLIVEGMTYYICFDMKSYNVGYKKNNVFYINQDIDVSIIYENMKIIYDMGQGAFSVKKKFERNMIEIQADNSFVLFNGKSIAFETYIYKRNNYDRVEELCRQLQPSRLAFSFVENKEDLEEALSLKEKHNFILVSKIETQKAIQNLDEILVYTDEIMLGRGDIGIYGSEKHLLDLCRKKSKPFYFASDFLTSWSYNYIPVRSELIDLECALELQPTGLILNVDLVLSSNINRVIKYIKEMVDK